jgi:hypothetical protein
VGGTAVAVLLYLLGGTRPQTPDMERFMGRDGPAWYSPPLLDALRNGSRRAHLFEDEERAAA